MCWRALRGLLCLHAPKNLREQMNKLQLRSAKSAGVVRASGNPKFDDWSREDFIAEIERLRKRKKYGLVWEEKPEDVVEQCKTALPVLKEVSGKAITKDADAPTNILIEGDNYYALSILNYTHAGKVDAIYADPPYNTGAKNWIYNNEWRRGRDGRDSPARVRLWRSRNTFSFSPCATRRW